MPGKKPSAIAVTIVALAQGLLTLALLLAGLGLGFSIPKPIPAVLALAALSGVAFAGLIVRRWWAVIPAALLIIGFAFCAVVLIGIGGIWMHGVEWFFLTLFALLMLAPIATIVVSVRATTQKRDPHG
jgi:hypothetical protein